MKIKQVALNLYTLRDHLKTPADMTRTLKRVRQIGYESVQISGVGPIDDGELARMMAGEGLVCCATHDNQILTDPGRVADRLHTFGCRHTAYPYPSGIKLDSLDDVKALAKNLNAAGKAIRDKGAILSYHNHHIEFRRFSGRLMLEVLYAETDPRYLQGEIDTYWVQYGGGDPLQWCRQLKGRLPLLHLKDYAINAENKPVFAEVGNGNLDWQRIVPAAEDSGCQWFIVEQDICPADAFDSVKMSWEYLRDSFCR